MSRYNSNQPPPYYAGGPSLIPSRNDQSLPQYRHHYDGVTVRLLVPTSRRHDDPEADARALDRFWGALILGFVVWLSVIWFTDAVETMRLLAVDMRKLLKRILEEMRRSGWDI